MCGVVGIIDSKNVRVEPSIISRSAKILYKRGPDNAGVWIEDNVGFGHQRLSVLDPTPAGHQPMVSPDGRYVIVHNGEIYNFRELRQQLTFPEADWESNSDTEVILVAYAKWGPKCVAHFHGMFAFSIWDRQEKMLFAARDRIGVKPFYYHYSPACFAFASRPRALFSLYPNLSREVDEQALRFYLECGYVPAPHSIYKDIRKLPPAHYLLFDSRGLRLQRYWDFRHITPQASWKRRHEEDLLDEMDQLISISVQSRMISDVPLGAFLSGGIDSSLVVAIMAKYSSKPIKTFTIGFDEKDYDESVQAKAVAKTLGTEHYCEYLRIKDLLQLMPIFIQEYDEPFFDSSAFPTMALSRLTRKYVTVSLSGDGGDELFGGYHYYRLIKNLGTFYNLPHVIRKTIALSAGLIPRHRFKLFAGSLNQYNITRAFAFSRSITKDFDSVLSPDILKQTEGIGELFSSASRLFPMMLHPCELGMRLDAFYTLPDEYLQKTDVASMAFSLESRDPLLDQDIVEWAMKLPLFWKLRRNTNKYLLRKLLYRYLPRKIVVKKKRGFEVPIDNWLRGPLKSWAEERICDKALFRNTPLNQHKILELWHLHNSRSRNVHPLLWAILMFMEFISKQKNQID